MKIAFNGVGCGWGNNGGTQSLFRMAIALSAIGHEVEVWSDSGNQFTWFDLPSKYVKYRKTTLKKAPAVDVLIASGAATVNSTFHYPRKRIGVNWVRAIETWTMSKKKLFAQYALPMPLWVNSEWMRNYISNTIGRNDISVIYPGIPFEQFYLVAPKSMTFTIGYLYSKKARKRWDWCVAIQKAFPQCRHFVFGNAKENSDDLHVDRYLCRPSYKAKRNLYSQCHVWFAPTDSEGLHIPPMEAALCGATVVGNAMHSAGLEDTCIHKETALMFKTKKTACSNIKHLMANPTERKELNARHVKVIREKIGSVRDNALIVERTLKEYL